MTNPTKPTWWSLLLRLLLATAIIAFAFYALIFHAENVQRIPSAIARRVQPAELGKILEAISWPVATVVIVVLLRVSFGALVSRIKELTWKDLKAIMHSVGDPQPLPTREAPE